MKPKRHGLRMLRLQVLWRVLLGKQELLLLDRIDIGSGRDLVEKRQLLLQRLQRRMLLILMVRWWRERGGGGGGGGGRRERNMGCTTAATLVAADGNGCNRTHSVFGDGRNGNLLLFGNDLTFWGRRRPTPLSGSDHSKLIYFKT